MSKQRIDTECLKCERPLPDHDPQYSETCEGCAETTPTSNYLADDWNRAVEQAYGAGGFKQ